MEMSPNVLISGDGRIYSKPLFHIRFLRAIVDKLICNIPHLLHYIKSARREANENLISNRSAKIGVKHLNKNMQAVLQYEGNT